MRMQLISFLERMIIIDENVIFFERIVFEIDEFHYNLEWFEMKVAKELKHLRQRTSARAQRTVDVASARHHARVLARQAVVLLTRSARSLLKSKLSI